MMRMLLARRRARNQIQHHRLDRQGGQPPPNELGRADLWNELGVRMGLRGWRSYSPSTSLSRMIVRAPNTSPRR